MCKTSLEKRIYVRSCPKVDTLALAASYKIIQRESLLNSTLRSYMVPNLPGDRRLTNEEIFSRKYVHRGASY